MFLTHLIVFGLKDCVSIPFQYSPVVPVTFQKPLLFPFSKSAGVSEPSIKGPKPGPNEKEKSYPLHVQADHFWALSDVQQAEGRDKQLGLTPTATRSTEDQRRVPQLPRGLSRGCESSGNSKIAPREEYIASTILRSVEKS